MPSLCGFENRLLHKDLIIVRNHGDDQEVAREGLGGVEGQHGRLS